MDKQKIYERIATADNFVTERIDVIENNLVGGYTEKNEYYIPNEIVNELLEIKKIKKDAFDSSIFCLGNIAGFGDLCFELKIENKGENLTFAKLYLLETVYRINGYLQNTIRTEIARIESADSNFIETAFDKFNIIVDYDGGKEQKIVDDEFFNGYIMAKKQYCDAMKSLIQDKYLDLYGKYFNTRMLLLKNLNNDFTKKVVNEYDNEVEKIEKYFYKYATNKNRNELLDKCIEDNSGILSKESGELEYKKEEEKITSQFSLDMSELETENESLAIELLNKNDKDKINDLRTVEKPKRKVEQKEEIKIDLNKDIKDVGMTKNSGR